MIPTIKKINDIIPVTQPYQIRFVESPVINKIIIDSSHVSYQCPYDLSLPIIDNINARKKFFIMMLMELSENIRNAVITKPKTNRYNVFSNVLCIPNSTMHLLITIIFGGEIEINGSTFHVLLQNGEKPTSNHQIMQSQFGVIWIHMLHNNPRRSLRLKTKKDSIVKSVSADLPIYLDKSL